LQHHVRGVLFTGLGCGKKKCTTFARFTNYQIFIFKTREYGEDCGQCQLTVFVGLIEDLLGGQWSFRLPQNVQN
jgi:hypothetical protein